MMQLLRNGTAKLNFLVDLSHNGIYLYHSVACWTSCDAALLEFRISALSLGLSGFRSCQVCSREESTGRYSTGMSY